MSSPTNTQRAAAAAGLVLGLLIALMGGSVFARLLTVPATQVTLSSFATSLEGRSAAQLDCTHDPALQRGQRSSMLLTEH